MHPLRRIAGERLNGIGIEAELQYVPWLGLDASQLGVNWFMRNCASLHVLHPNDEVGDAADAVVNERHLVENVVVQLERIADPSNPVGKQFVLTPLRHLKDRLSLSAVVLETS